MENSKYKKWYYRIIEKYSNVGDTMKNGRKMSYIQAFCKKYSSEYNITLQGMKRVVLEECWKNV